MKKQHMLIKKKLQLPRLHIVLFSHNKPPGGREISTCSQNRGNYLAPCTVPCLYKQPLDQLALCTSQPTDATPIQKIYENCHGCLHYLNLEANASRKNREEGLFGK